MESKKRSEGKNLPAPGKQTRTKKLLLPAALTVAVLSGAVIASSCETPTPSEAVTENTQAERVDTDGGENTNPPEFDQDFPVV